MKTDLYLQDYTITLTRSWWFGFIYYYKKTKGKENKNVRLRR